ncbi:MAG: hypothetical protein QRY72_00635, partial [Candidatus Rhabdochlamydia sp.]
MSTSINAKIPFQPGLALGSIVRGDIIEKLDKYGQVQAQIDKIERELNVLEQEAKKIDAKIQAVIQSSADPKIKDPNKLINASITKAYEAQKKSIDAQIERIPKRIDKLINMNDCDLPVFANISTGLETPIDFDKTVIGTEIRGFDTISFSSSYIDMNEDSSSHNSSFDQSSSANSAGISGSYGVFTGSASHSWSNAAMDRVEKIKSEGKASKILVVNSLVTTRNVRVLKQRAYDNAKLNTILEKMKSFDLEEGKIPNQRGRKKYKEKVQELNDLGIAVINNIKQIYILTEAVMGGSFSAIVTYLKEDRSNQDVEDHAKSKSSNTSISIGAKALLWGANGKFDRSSQEANESHAMGIYNLNNLNISIEFIAQGIIPQMARESVIREAIKQQQHSFRQYQPNGSTKEDQSARERQAELQVAMYQAITSKQSEITREEIPVHTPNTILKAYDDFCAEISTDAFGGVPIGFNYAILTEKNIEDMVKKDDSSANGNKSSPAQTPDKEARRDEGINDGLENDGLENDGLENDGLENDG